MNAAATIESAGHLPACAQYACRLDVREGIATVGIDVVAIGSAPSGKGLRVDVRLDHDDPLPHEALVQLLGRVFPLQEGRMEFVPVNEKRS